MFRVSKGVLVIFTYQRHSAADYPVPRLSEYSRNRLLLDVTCLRLLRTNYKSNAIVADNASLYK